MMACGAPSPRSGMVFADIAPLLDTLAPLKLTFCFNPSTTIPTSCAALTSPLALTALILSSSSFTAPNHASPGRVSLMVVINCGDKMISPINASSGFARD